MDTSTFDSLRRLIEAKCGIHLSTEKQQLLTNRLQKRLRVLGLSQPSQYLKIIETDAEGTELLNLLDVVSTNTTFFHREERHFEIYAKNLASRAQQGRQDIKVWCAASSTGEEPYQLAFTAMETVHPKLSKVRVLATDISRRVLQHAIERTYEARQVDKLPRTLLEKYFTSLTREKREIWQVRSEVAELVTFKRLNLNEHPFPLKGDIDIIFCRNVMIYFQKPLRQKIISEFERLLRPDGLLFLGHSENLLGVEHHLEPVTTAVYRLKSGGR